MQGDLIWDGKNLLLMSRSALQTGWRYQHLSLNLKGHDTPLGPVQLILLPGLLLGYEYKT